MVLLIPLEFVKASSWNAPTDNRKSFVKSTKSGKWSDTFWTHSEKNPYKTYQENTVFNKATKENERVLEERINHAYLFLDQLNINSNVTSKKEP